jgi:hypothetical protein
MTLGCGYTRGINWILDLLTQLGTANNHRAIADLCSLQITATNTKSSQARSVFNSRFLVKDVSSEDSSASRSQMLPVRRTSHN